MYCAKRLSQIVLSSLILLAMLILCSCGVSEVQEETPPPVLYDVTITLNYEEVFLTTNSPMNVYVDDINLGRQEAGTEESYTVSLEAGEYEFYLKNDGIYSTDKLTFQVSPQTQTFRFGAKTRLTFGMEVWEE